MHRIQKVIKVSNCLIFYQLGRCVSEDVEHLISITFQCTLHLESILFSSTSTFLSLQPAASPLTSPIQRETMRFHLRADNDAWAWWETLFRCCHYKAIFFHRPHVKEIQRQGPKCNSLISLKLFIGICGALAAGLSPFQLPDLFNSVGNEKCAAQLELRSKKPSRLSLSLSLSFILSLSNHYSHTC